MNVLQGLVWIVCVAIAIAAAMTGNFLLFYALLVAIVLESGLASRIAARQHRKVSKELEEAQGAIAREKYLTNHLWVAALSLCKRPTGESKTIWLRMGLSQLVASDAKPLLQGDEQDVLSVFEVTVTRA